MKRSKKLSNKLKSILIAFVTLITCVTCAQERSGYEVDVIYSPKRHVVPSNTTQTWKNQVKDSIVFFFESGFKNDNVTITVGSNKSISKITSNQVIQFAKFIPIAPVANGETVSIQINSGKIITLKPTDDIKFIALNFIDNKVVVQVLDDFAYYD